MRGYTVHPSSGVQHPGTFAGLAEKIDYLKWLGITAVELLPVDEFDENDCPFVNPLTGEKLKNFWGYNPIAFGAPKAAYAINPERSEPWDEFCEHGRRVPSPRASRSSSTSSSTTPPKGAKGGRPTTSAAWTTRLYYMLDDHGRYLNFSGCGNTFNSDHPVVRNYLIACLRNWVAEAGVDGFRFDLASVFGRDHRGNVLVNPPAVNRISEDSLLYDTKLIAEPWDAAGLYQVGTFPGGARWSDWNGRYRDDVRRFWRGEPGMTSALATRLCGSDDLYARPRAAALDQLHLLPRRVHAQRPGLLQPEAQRGQRRGQPRRQRRQLELELRRRGADGRCPVSTGSASGRSAT